MLGRHESDEIRYLERDAWETERLAAEEFAAYPEDWQPIDLPPEPRTDEEEGGDGEYPF